MRAWANADMIVRRAAIELLLFDTTSVPARPRLAIPRMASPIRTSMSVMPRGAVRRSVCKAAPPEEPAEQADRGLTIAVQRRRRWRRSNLGWRFQDDDLLVGDDGQGLRVRVPERRSARASRPGSVRPAREA